MNLPFEILYEDNHLIVVNKKPSQLVQGDKTGDEPLSEMVKSYIKINENKPGDVYLALPHRIDRPVSGIVVMAKTSKAGARISKMFLEREIKKTYWAIVKNKPDQKSDHLVHWLIKNQSKNQSKAFWSEQKNAKKAELDYSLLSSSDRYHLLEVKPITGRHHQIRVQLSAIGCPIKGDIKYGFDRTNPDGSISLHAREIEFLHPVRKEKMIVKAHPPKSEKLWEVFENI